jgi:hypothetical protein
MARDRNRPLGLLTGKNDYTLFKMMTRMRMIMMMKLKEITALVVKIVTNTNAMWKNAEFLELHSSVNIVTSGVYTLNAKMIKCPMTFTQSS